jgi:hypothetical protein
MKRKDYIPGNDEEFNILQNNVYTTAAANATQWLIPPQFINDLGIPRDRWEMALAAYRNPATRTHAVTQEKNDSRKAYEPMLRTFIQGQIMHNSKVSNAARLDMGLHVYDQTPTTPPAPGSRPEVEVDFSQILKHTIHVRDSEMKGTGKPKHVIGFELWRRIGGDSEPAFEEMELVEVVMRSPHTVEYTSAQRRQIAWYATRWINSQGKGPWSEIVSAVIP